MLGGLVMSGTREIAPGVHEQTGLAALAEIVRDQEHRLRVLEPCAGRVVSGEPHAWGHFEPAPDALTCRYCGITKEPPR